MLTKSRPSSRPHGRGNHTAAFFGDWPSDPRFAILAGWLAMVFLFGGSSRADLGSLPLIRPISLFVLAYGLSKLSLDEIRQNRLLLACALAWFCLLVLHLVPLPPAIWQALGGRAILRDIDSAAGLGDVWRPLSMAPYATWNALWAFATPAAVLVLGVGLEHDDRMKIGLVLIMLAFASAFIAALQILGDPKGPLYFYRYTNNGLPVGLLANRNNQALLLATTIPMLAAWGFAGGHGTKVDQGRWLWVVGGIILLIPMILITGSRTGMLMGLIGLLTLPLFMTGAKALQFENTARIRKLVAVGLLGAIAAILGITIALGRALSIDRMLTVNAAEDLRFHILPTLINMITTYFPWGTGIGSFYPVYQMNEPDKLLSPVYMNQAHNDWLDLALTGGLPALLLLAALLLGLTLRLPAAFRSASPRPARMVRLGFVIILMLGLASATEYPVRVPTVSCLGVIALLWVTSRDGRDKTRDFAGANV